MDILEDRRLVFLEKYFFSFPRKVRNKVRGVVMDRYSPYMSLVRKLFPHAEIILDRFPIVQDPVQVFKYDEGSADEGIFHFFPGLQGLQKKYWKLLLKAEEDLRSVEFSHFTHFKEMKSQKTVVHWMLELSPTLRACYEVVNGLRVAIKFSDFPLFQRILTQWKGQEVLSEQMRRALETAAKYLKETKAALKFSYRYSRTEGINGKIKLIMRTGYGYRNSREFKDANSALLSKNRKACPSDHLGTLRVF